MQNLAYSIILHLLLIFFLYFSFNLDNLEQEDLNEISVDIEFSELKTVIPPQIEEVKQEKTQEKREEKKPDKKSEKKEKREEIKPEKKENKKEEKITESEKKEDPKVVEKPPEKLPFPPLKPLEPDNTIEKLRLSAREKLNISSQIKRCYQKAIKDSGKTSEVLILVKINITIDGRISSNLNEIIDFDAYNNDDDLSYKIAIDNASNALKYCNPLRNLPQNKYDRWKEITLQFDGRNE